MNTDTDFFFFFFGFGVSISQCCVLPDLYYSYFFKYNKN